LFVAQVNAEENAMKKIAQHVAYAIGLASAVGAVALAPSVAVADLNQPALACQAPFLDQADPMRWHEHYLMNPATNRGTWVVCPLPIETDNMNATFWIGAYGNFLPGNVTVPPGEFPVCLVNIIDLANQDLAGYINNPGQRRIYTAMLATQNPVNTLWAAESPLSVQNVINAMGGRTNGPDFWGVSVNCYLPTGYALNMVSQY
jgi:hypothetical protein